MYILLISFNIIPNDVYGKSDSKHSLYLRVCIDVTCLLSTGEGGWSESVGGGCVPSTAGGM